VLNKTDVNVIACIGETLQEREAGKTNEVVERQVKSYQGILSLSIITTARNS
jgi:triosephosphate isomerase